MKKSMHFSLLLVLLILLSSACTVVNNTTVDEDSHGGFENPRSNELKSETDDYNMPEVRPESFNFHIQYGVNKRNEVNTFDHVIVKDLVMDGTASIEFYFSKEELDEIYEKFMKADVFSQKTFEVEMNCGMEPYEHYYLKVAIDENGETYTAEYEFTDQYCVLTEDGNKLKGIIQLINGMVRDTEEYQSLPPAEGGYD
ncbi:hypothetical protein [Evansella tamaricis]|uniref:Lipoprotein n=1 Tax=Evansella tamaricis TaxID=2069301 RepID=A0ABS6JG42_9BACI|nr:hypothetical protein [Evansella tamaricis]MBU9712634.1 hypothetical protein [Evansella tamaricis]